MSYDKAVSKLEEIIGYIFPDGDKDQAWNALQYDNTALAMGGNTVIKLVIVEDMLAEGFERGSIHDQVTRVEGKANLDRIGRLTGIDKCIVPHPGQQGQDIAPKTMTATIEAVLWVVYVSSGKTTTSARTVMIKLGLWPGKSQPKENGV